MSWTSMSNTAFMRQHPFSRANPGTVHHDLPKTGDEQLVRCHSTRCQALLVHVLPERGERRPIGLDSIAEEVTTENTAALLDMIDQPWDRDPQCVGVVEAIDSHVPRVAECPVETLRDP